MLDFKKALKMIKREEIRGNNPVPDLLSFLHIDTMYGSDLDSILEDYFQFLLHNQWGVKALLRIDVPKANFTIRPMSRPPLKEWLIYEAIIDSLASEILEDDPEICSRSFSILKFKGKVDRATDPWLKFEDRTRKLYNSGYEYVVVTDITGYFENISLEQLRSRILDFLPGDSSSDEYVNVLFNMLRKWSSERIEGFGLPQGPPGSFFLADLFLDHVDRKMERYKGYLRYMDDIRIFCKSAVEAKVALKDLIISLRELKLSINAKKTDILHRNDIENVLFDPQSNLMTVTDEIMNSGDRELIQTLVVPSLFKLFEGALSNDPFEKRHLNFSLYRLDVLRNSGFDFDEDKVVQMILENLEKRPHHTGIFCSYLENFAEDSKVWDNLFSFLTSEHNIYEWQELKILQCLLKFKVKPSKKDVDVLLHLCQDRNKHPVVSSLYILLVGKHGSNRDRDLIVDMYNHDSHEHRKMAVVLAVQELGKASRNRFYGRLKRTESQEIGRFVDYVKSLQNPLYYLQVSKPRIQTYDKSAPAEY